MNGHLLLTSTSAYMLVLSEAYLHPQTVKTDRWLIDADGQFMKWFENLALSSFSPQGRQPNLRIKVSNCTRASQVRTFVFRLPRPPQN
jgi:hypothetical protein